jgi:lipoprotein LprG
LTSRAPKLLPALLLGVLLAVACGGGGGGGEGGPLPAADDVLAGLVARVDALKTFHFRLEHENGTSPIPLGLDLETAEGDVVVPDRMSAEIGAKANGAVVQVKVIGVGDKGWITNPFSREWQPLPEGTNIKDVFDPAAGVKAVVGALTNAKVVKEEKVAGVSTYLVEGEVDSGVLEAAAPVAEPGLTVSVKAWVGVDDSLPRRIRLEGPFAPGEPDNIVRKLDLSRFDEPLTIEPPI